MTDYIILSAATVASLSPELKAELAGHLTLLPALPSTTERFDNEEHCEYAELGLQAARAFLLGCSDRTIEVLTLIVKAGESFSLRELERASKVGNSGLRGVWTGLTKRVRTITGDADTALIEWSGPDENDDYRGRLAPMTLDAFRRALAE